MRRATLLFIFGAALTLLGAHDASAIGFGRTVSATTLGQPLNFYAYIALEGEETLGRECVGAEVLIGDNHVAPENVRVTLESARETGERRVRVTTRSIVDEPVVTVNVSVGCGSQMSRRFVAFVDPPALGLASAGDEAFTPQRIDNQIAPLLDIVQAADARRRGERDGRRDAARLAADDRRDLRRAAPGRRMAASSIDRGAPMAAPRERTTPAAARLLAGSGSEAASPRATPRLRLDAAAPLVIARAPAAAAAAEPSSTAIAASASPTGSVAAAGPASAAVGIAAAASAPGAVAAAASAPAGFLVAGDAANIALDQVFAREAAAVAAAQSASAALAGERERILQLEAGLARLKSDSQAQQQTLGALQARLRQAEGERYANGLVYGLAGGVCFFALLAAALYALRPRQRRGARWFDAAKPQRRAARSEAAAAPPRVSDETARTPAVSQHPSQWNDGPPSILPVTAPATIGGLEVTTVLAPQSQYARTAGTGASANSALVGVAARGASHSIEELIDLEQQVEFFVVLGQDEAAIALLSAHTQDDGSPSPLPYLQLLEIHQRRDDRTAHDDVRSAFRRHFKVEAPEWSDNPNQHTGRALEAYPQAVARLQALWPTPLQAMQSLDGLLFRRAENDETFDLPAYRELLLLYSVARDHAGSVETDAGPIDLFLPLEEAPTEPIGHHDKAAFAVDLDVSSWATEMRPEDLVIVRSVGRRNAH